MERGRRSFHDRCDGHRKRWNLIPVATRFGLRGGLTEAEAADVLWSLTSPELADRFTRRRGWTLDRYQQWLAQAMADALVGPDGAGGFA